MSVNENDALYELAAEHLEYWTNTQWEDRIQNALDRDDLEELEVLLKKSAAEMFRLEYNPEDVAHA